ncbi:uncharacterized protein LOC108740808 isoform X2 [Agrilus planipennis]|uniref:Uncharacterized protein LOC108740808 isoform X2 n=1 Tax=Agrilus planipennis TaxID=224129 RepID=A0A7F5RBF8_AGRPL|nr:uncharacterized protein LOC108740808 isoform X2 [Agrilus planipennis]
MLAQIIDDLDLEQLPTTPPPDDLYRAYLRIFVTPNISKGLPRLCDVKRLSYNLLHHLVTEEDIRNQLRTRIFDSAGSDGMRLRDVNHIPTRRLATLFNFTLLTGASPSTLPVSIPPSSHRAAEPIGCAMSESQRSATPIGPNEHERVRSNSFVSCASEASVMECSSESGKRKKTTPWCDDEPECLSAAENKKMRRRDSGETCRTYDYSGVGTFEGGDH